MAEAAELTLKLLKLGLGPVAVPNLMPARCRASRFENAIDGLPRGKTFVAQCDKVEVGWGPTIHSGRVSCACQSYRFS